MAYDAPRQTIISIPGRTIQFNTGTSITITFPSPHCIVDGHAHIENGACVPLPLFWDKSWLIRGKTRKQIDDESSKGIKGTLFSLLKGEAGPIQVMSTFNIGNRAVKDNENAFAADTLIGSSRLYNPSPSASTARDFYSFLIILMMDMEYAHIAGLHGQTIYHEEESPWYYYKRQSGLLDENKGIKIPLPGENQLTFAKWRKQLRETTCAVKANPLRLFPMYFYAPQRWNLPKNTKFDAKNYAGSWDYPFEQIATPKKKGLFLGFKMYNPLGSQPLDSRLPYLHDTTLEGDCFYARCEREGIPIIVHCSPGGMTSHELKFFMEHDSGQPQYQNQSQNPAVDSIDPADATAVAIDNEAMAVNYFYDNYVHPKAWRKVLQKYPKLKLCLAHLGGDELKNGLNSTWVTEIIALTEDFTNVYTDLSCWDINAYKETLHELLLSLKYAHIRNKLLFGTDWYMTLIALGGKSYKSFCEDTWKAFMELPDGEKLWVNCTFLNPFTFYGFYEEDPATGVRKVDNIAAAIKTGKHDKAKLSENFAHFNRLQNEFNKLIKERKDAGGR